MEFVINCYEWHSSASFDSKNPKIEFFDKETKEYLGSTNFYKTCKEAKAFYLNLYKQKVIAKKSKGQKKSILQNLIKTKNR
jgi:hypothetical protein